MSTGPALLISVVLLAANAFFVAAEFALVSARRSAVEPLAAAGDRAARRALEAMEQVSLAMATAQLGITVCSLGLGYLGEPAIAHALESPFDALGAPEALVHPVAFAIALALVTLLHVVLGEVVPKNLALAGPDRAALVLARPLLAVMRALGPAVRALNAVANACLRLVGVTPVTEVASTFTRDEVAGLVAASGREGLLEPAEAQLATAALGFEARDVAAVLLPLDQLRCVAPGVTPAQLEALAAETGFSRFPVRDPEGGALTGYLHLKDTLEPAARHRERPVAAGRVRPLAQLAAGDGLRAALTTMQRSRAHLAAVAGPDGAPLGVVTLEDVLEELVGQISPEPAAG